MTLGGGKGGDSMRGGCRRSGGLEHPSPPEAWGLECDVARKVTCDIAEEVLSDVEMSGEEDVDEKSVTASSIDVSSVSVMFLQQNVQ